MEFPPPFQNILRPLKNVQFRLSSRKASRHGGINHPADCIVGTGIHTLSISRINPAKRGISLLPNPVHQGR